MCRDHGPSNFRLNSMQVVPPILKLPNETLSYIAVYVPKSDCATALTVCTKLYPFFATRVYQEIAVDQSRRRYRMPLIALAGTHIQVADCAMFTLRFSFCGDFQSDDFLTFPILCLSLFRMRNLLDLDIRVTKASSSFLLECMDRYQLINKRMSVWGNVPSGEPISIVPRMPHLRSFTFRHDPEMLNLCSFRNVTSLTITNYLGYVDVDEMMSQLEETNLARQLTELSLRLQPSTDVNQILRRISDIMPSLLLLCINHARLNPKVSSMPIS
jgi:hypothetical protein